MQQYDADFFSEQKGGSMRSAEIITPYILSLIKPKNVVDVGCGVGTWLKVFQENGIQNILGIDGEYVDRKQLQIDPSVFQTRDLEKPFTTEEKFDLVVSLEVAEHLAEKNAPIFVHSLTSLAPKVLFSAAIPGQGGTHHTNEQWPDYWEQLFKNEGYIAYDCIRPRFWNNDNVEYWYIQNMILYVHKDNAQELELKQVSSYQQSPISRLVHPRLYREVNARINPSLHLVQSSVWHYFKKIWQQSRNW